MSKHNPKEGYATARETMRFIGCNGSQLRDYRERNIIDGHWYQVGRYYYYHLVNCNEKVKASVNQVNNENTNESEEETLKKLGIKSKAFSERKKAHYVAKQKELEFDKARGNLIDVSEFTSDVDDEAREIRDALLAIAPGLAPLLVPMDDVNKIEALIESRIRKTLAGLFNRFLDND